MKIRPSHRHKRRNQALFPSSRVTANPRIQQALTASLTFVSVSFAIGQPSSDPSSSVGERGYDFVFIDV